MSWPVFEPAPPGEVLSSYGEATNKDAEALKSRILAEMKAKKEATRKEALEATIVRPPPPANF